MTFQPMSPADERLLAQVRPEGWENPDPKGRYDLVVVGAGTGGLVSAAIATALGARVALVERGLMGGDCLNFGCVPSKAVIRASRSWAEARDSARRFGGPGVTGEGDFFAVMTRMRELRAGISEVDGARRFRSLGVDVFLGEARFEGPDSLVVEGTPMAEGARLRFRRAILATGARPAVPVVPGLEDVPFLTNETVFNLNEVPRRFLVLGAGPIGCELAQAFARFGSSVSILDVADRPLPGEEPEASEVLLSALSRDGVEFHGGARETRVGPGSESVAEVMFQSEGGRLALEVDAVLVATGRVPNTDLGLDEAGVAFDGTGVKVDDRLRTSNRRIYAVGDVASALKFTHVADAQARIAVRNAMFFGRAKASSLAVPMSTYTSPEVARVGPTASKLHDRGVAFDTVRVPFEEVDRARLDGGESGLAQVHLRRGTDEILGATVVATHAGDLISQVGQAMTLGVGLEAMGEVIFPYPTTAEAFRKLADKRRREKLTPRVRRFFDLLIRATRLLP